MCRAQARERGLEKKKLYEEKREGVITENDNTLAHRDKTKTRGTLKQPKIIYNWRVAVAKEEGRKPSGKKIDAGYSSHSPWDDNSPPKETDEHAYKNRNTHILI